MRDSFCTRSQLEQPWLRTHDCCECKIATSLMLLEVLLRGTARRAVAAASRRDLTVAVTGASGYVGSYITEELLKRGHDVRALVRGCDTNTEKAAHLQALPGAERLTLIDGGDLSIQGSFEAGLAGADAVVHAAATVVIGRDPSIASAAVDGVENVLSSLPATCKTFVLTSSIAAVISLDKASLTFDEDDWNDYSSLRQWRRLWFWQDAGRAPSERSLQEHQLRRAPPRHRARARDDEAAHEGVAGVCEELITAEAHLKSGLGALRGCKGCGGGALYCCGAGIRVRWGALHPVQRRDV